MARHARTSLAACNVGIAKNDFEGGVVMHNGKRNDKLQHATITLRRSYTAPLERVFSEFADPVARASWGSPSNDELIYDEADFRIGGKDVFRCGPKGNPKFRGEPATSTSLPMRVSFQAKQSTWTVSGSLSRSRRSISSRRKAARI
jgi:hypothetical protein